MANGKISIREVGGAGVGLETTAAPLPPRGEGRTDVNPTRRRFSKTYKLQMLGLAEACESPGQIGLLLRREGLYSSHLTSWRRWRRTYMTDPNSTKQTSKELRNENARLKRENVRLQLKLKRAEGLLELQKKLAEMMDRPNEDDATEKTP